MPTSLSVAAVVAIIAQSFVFYLAGGLDLFVIGWTAICACTGVVFAFITITWTE